MKSVKYLELVKQRYGLKNDRQLATHMGKTSGTISQYMNGQRVMDEETCLAVSMMLEYDEHETMKVMMAAGMDRAEKAGQKSLWSVFSERMAATAATALLAVGVNLFLTHGDAQAAEMRTVAHADAENINYAKLLRTLGRTVVPILAGHQSRHAGVRAGVAKIHGSSTPRCRS